MFYCRKYSYNTVTIKMIKLINDRVSKEKLRFNCWIKKISAALCVYPNNGLSLEPPGKKIEKKPPPPPEIASVWTPHSPQQFSFLSCFRGEGMDVFWNYTMHIGDSKLCCFHSPVSTLQTWLTTSRPGGHVQKSRYRDFLVSSSLSILRTKTVEHDNIVKQLK